MVLLKRPLALQTMRFRLQPTLPVTTMRKMLMTTWFLRPQPVAQEVSVFSCPYIRFFPTLFRDGIIWLISLLWVYHVVLVSFFTWLAWRLCCKLSFSCLCDKFSSSVCASKFSFAPSFFVGYQTYRRQFYNSNFSQRILFALHLLVFHSLIQFNSSIYFLRVYIEKTMLATF